MLRDPKNPRSDRSAPAILDAPDRGDRDPQAHDPHRPARRERPESPARVKLAPGVRLAVNELRNFFTGRQRRQHELERELRERGRTP